MIGRWRFQRPPAIHAPSAHSNALASVTYGADGAVVAAASRGWSRGWRTVFRETRPRSQRDPPPTPDDVRDRAFDRLARRSGEDP